MKRFISTLLRLKAPKIRNIFHLGRNVIDEALTRLGKLMWFVSTDFFFFGKGGGHLKLAI